MSKPKDLKEKKKKKMFTKRELVMLNFAIEAAIGTHAYYRLHPGKDGILDELELLLRKVKVTRLADRREEKNFSLEECPTCGEVKNDVREREDHYAQEIGGKEGASMICCADCEEQNALDI